MSKLTLALGTLLLMAAGAQAATPRKAAVLRKERELILVANLKTHGVDNYKWLYKFLEVHAVSMAWEKLGLSYDHIYVLNGKHATLQGFQDSLSATASPDAVKAVDVFVHLHGAPNALYFEEGPVETARLGAALASDRGNAGKLRLLYSTACYGVTHAPDFLTAGFQAVNGSLAVNTNSVYEYPTIMTAWRRGDSFMAAQDRGNSTFWRELYDGIARKKGFPDSDSFKVVRGDGDVTIDATGVPMKAAPLILAGGALAAVLAVQLYAPKSDAPLDHDLVAEPADVADAVDEDDGDPLPSLGFDEPVDEAKVEALADQTLSADPVEPTVEAGLAYIDAIRKIPDAAPLLDDILAYLKTGDAEGFSLEGLQTDANGLAVVDATTNRQMIKDPVILAKWEKLMKLIAAQQN